MPIFQDNRMLVRRLGFARVLFAISFFLFFIQLWFLSVLNHEHYRQLAEQNRIRTFPQIAPRGLIYDREGRVLADNVFEFNLLLFREEAHQLEKTVQFLTDGLSLNAKSIEEILRKAAGYDLYQPAVIKEDLSMEDVAYLLAHQPEHPELGIVKQPRRLYRYGNLAAHVLGYVGEISLEQLQQLEFAQNKPSNLVGQYGVERSHNQTLTGIDGLRRVLVDSRGRNLGDVENVAPIIGKPLKMTIDLDLQEIAESGLGNDTGAMVAFDARTGEIMAMVSRPTFDPNQFARNLSPEEWSKLIDQPDSPLQNRVFQNAFSPGSIFKIIMALAGLERSVINASSVVRCTGEAMFYNRRFRCWREAGHGKIALKEAIQHSCNIYFYNLGQKLGIQDIETFSRRIGLGAKTGINLLGEVSGLVPSEKWKKRARGEPWYPGETISVAIGQGPLLATPLQLARAISIIATGRVPMLHLVEPNPDFPKAATLPVLSADFVPGNLEQIREAMWSVVNDGGTGQAAQVANFEVCGKTGTAQTVSRAVREGLSENSAERFEPNAWFVGFAPRNDPELVVAVIVQRGGAGGGSAARIAGEMFRGYSKKYRTSGAGSAVVFTHDTADKIL
jgi:penicillin-binding protein 2